MSNIIYTYDGDLGIPGVDKKDFFSTEQTFPHVRIFGGGLSKTFNKKDLINDQNDWIDLLVMEDTITENVAERVIGLVVGKNNNPVLYKRGE